METTSNFDAGIEANEPSGVKQKLGQVGRKLKNIDVRQSIADHPFAAVGIAAAAGAIVGLVRPKKQSGRISGLLFATLGGIGFRLVREAAVTQLGAYAKNYLRNRDDQQADSFGGQNKSNVEGGNVRYSPTL